MTEHSDISSAGLARNGNSGLAGENPKTVGRGGGLGTLTDFKRALKDYEARRKIQTVGAFSQRANQKRHQRASCQKPGSNSVNSVNSV